MGRFRIAAVIFSLVVFASCSFFSGPQQTTFRHQEDAGTVQVAVQSVAPFEDYISSLEPQFSLSTQDALTAALAQTQTEDSQFIRELLANASVALPQITRTTSKKITADGTTTTTNETLDHESKPGTTGDVKIPDAAVKAADLALPTNNGSVDFDQALKYRAAAALLQEVALLNHYVRDAAVKQGTRPYIVRLLVTVLPSARNEPYDAYTTISFFTDENGKYATSWIYRTFLISAMNAAKKEPPPKPTEDSLAVQSLQDVASKWSCGNEPVSVIPLLVTDDLESSLHQNSATTVRDIAAALQGTLSNVGVGLGARNRAQDLDKTLNRNLNSIFALGQAGPNAVQARLGAAYANGRYVTVARTYNVSLLVMVKTASDRVVNAKNDAESLLAGEMIPCPGIVFTAQTEMRNVDKGKAVPLATEVAKRRTMDALRRALDLPSEAPNLQTLFDAAVTGDFNAFARSYGTGNARRTAFAWTQAVATAQARGWSSGEFRVPLSDVTLPANNRDQFTVFDDGSASRLAINDATNLLPDRLRAVLRVQTNDPAHEWMFLVNDSVEVGPDGRRATFTFPSVSALLGPQVTPKNVFAEVRYMPGLRNWQTGGERKVSLEWHTTIPARDCSKTPADDVCTARTKRVIEDDEVPIAYFAAPQPQLKPGFSVDFPSRVIRAGTDGTGELALEIRSDDVKAPKQVHIRLTDGAFVDDITPAVTFLGADRVATDGAYVLKLKNLKPGTKVALSTFRVDGKKSIPFAIAPIDVVAK